MDEITVGIYVPSYKRSNDIETWYVLDGNCTYVVRESEEQKYREAGITKILSAPDELINSAQKVRYWILENTPEDIIIQIDDDVKEFRYTSHFSDVLTKDEIFDELYRVCQIMSDLKIGYGGTRNVANILTYSQEVRFTGTIGTVDIFNKSVFKAKPDPMASYAEDTDRVLQELLINRIVFVSAYFGIVHDIDGKAGGDTDNKTVKKLNTARDYLMQKWGKYYRYQPQNNTSVITVKR